MHYVDLYQHPAASLFQSIFAWILITVWNIMYIEQLYYLYVNYTEVVHGYRYVKIRYINLIKIIFISETFVLFLRVFYKVVMK